jgi:hypothetical protein
MGNEDITGIKAETSIQAVRVQDVWEYIKPAIESIVSELPWRDFRAEDVYASCTAGESVVFVDAGVPLGESFFVARVDEEAMTKEKVMSLWIAYSSSPNAAGRVMEAIEQIAANSGCSYIEFITGSEKLVEYGKANGFDKIMYEVRKSVTPRIPQGGE